jgi:hypothetical protein
MKRSPKPVETAVEVPGRKKPVLVPQPHGGALLSGGTGSAGPGRPPSVVTAAARLAFDKRLPTLERIADKDDAQDKDRIRAIEVLGNFGFGKDMSMARLREKLGSTLELLRQRLPAEQVEPLIVEIRAIWTG